VAEPGFHALAERSGETVERLEEWHSAGLIRTDGQPEPRDVERVRLIRFLVRRGFELDTIARAERNREGLLDAFIGLAFPSGGFPSSTLAEAAASTSLELSLLQRLWDAAGFDQDGPVGHADVEMIGGLEVALAAGLPEAALVELVRVYADSLRRVAEAEVRLFHFHVHERLRAAGLPDDELRTAVDTASGQLQTLIEPAILYFHQKGWLSAIRDDLALHVAEEAGVADVTEIPGPLSVAIVFTDLARFTPLTEAMGDQVAAEVVDRFSNIVRTTVSKCYGRVVKQIGDAYMLVFFEPTSALTCALEIEERAAAASHFPAVRAGAHWGPVLYREGDYVGATVNLAARLEAEAGPHQLLVTTDLRDASERLAGVEFLEVGSRMLKGMTSPVQLLEATRSGTARRKKVVDVVCGMELTPSEVAVTLERHDETQAFCSNECLQRFVAAPERYGG
jgi:adenylate cyclase